MRTSRLILIGGCALVLAFGGASAAATFASPQEALKQGLGAYQGGYYDQAIPALESAAEDGEFMALYYLARIYSDNSGAHTAHARAYQLFKRIVDEYADLDPDEDERAPLVGRSLTALANYTRRGLPEIGLAANLERAIEYLHNASVIFNDEDAQFELAKLQLKGEGVVEDVPKAKHWLSVLTQRGHAGAQAFLADLLWRGKYMPPDQPRALALISIAVENAPSNERLWIEDIYQNIFCGAGDGIRKQASGIVAGWGNRYGRKPDERDRSDLDQLNAVPQRTCQNGETVGPIKGEFSPGEDGGAVAETPQRQPRGFLQGSSGAGLRDVAAPDQARGDR